MNVSYIRVDRKCWPWFLQLCGFELYCGHFSLGVGNFMNYAHRIIWTNFETSFVLVSTGWNAFSATNIEYLTIFVKLRHWKSIYQIGLQTFPQLSKAMAYTAIEWLVFSSFYTRLHHRTALYSVSELKCTWYLSQKSLLINKQKYLFWIFQANYF